MNYNILIVDDEEWIRKGFIARLDYLKFTPDQVFEAADGQEALQIVEERRPEIIVTDIRMPDMTGLELITKTKERHPDTQFVILSGYAEFAYAESAIKIGVNGYLLKPMSNSEIERVMKLSLEKLEKQKEVKKSLVQIELFEKEQKRQRYERSVNMVIHNQNAPEGDLETVLEALAIGDEKHSYLSAVLQIDGSTYEEDGFDYQDAELIRFCVKNVFDELEADGFSRIMVKNTANLNQLFVVLASQNSVSLRRRAEEIFIRLKDILWRKLKISLSVGVGLIEENLNCGGDMILQEALKQRFLYGKGGIYFFEDRKVFSKDSYPSAELNMLQKYIERGDIGNIGVMLKEIFSKDRLTKNGTFYIRILWLKILEMLFKQNCINQEDPKKSEKITLSFELFEQASTVDSLIESIYRLIVERIPPDGDMNARNKIRMAICYIEENYNQELAVNDLADKYNMSPNHFSAEFKKETGLTAVAYIKEIRVKKAKEFLKKTDKSVTEIAKSVGYEDGQYFFRIFKKMTGITPLEYRKVNRLKG